VIAIERCVGGVLFRARMNAHPPGWNHAESTDALWKLEKSFVKPGDAQSL
jgi:hypothetical protein